MGLYSFPTHVSLTSAPSGIDTTQVYNNGQLGFTSDGKGYRYVEVDVTDAVDWAVGHPVGCMQDATDFTVTADQSDSLVPCRIALDVIDVSEYSSPIWVWIQVSGLATTTATNADITGGQPLIWSGDGVVDHFADGGEELVFAHAVTHTGTATANSTYVILHIL